MQNTSSIVSKIGELFLLQIKTDPIFFVISTTILLTAIMVVTQKNLVRAGFLLMACFGAVALSYFSLGAEFVGASQILIYAVGVTLIILFAIMLIKGSLDSPINKATTECNKTVDKKIETTFNLILSFSIFTIMNLAYIGLAYYKPFRVRIKDFVGYAQLQKNSLNIGESQSILEIGKRMMSEQLLPFELTSILLLIVFVAAIMIARGDNHVKECT